MKLGTVSNSPSKCRLVHRSLRSAWIGMWKIKVVLFHQFKLIWIDRLIFYQDKIYVQFVELCQFENEFRELVNKFSENEKIINRWDYSWKFLKPFLIDSEYRLIMTGFGNSLEEITNELEECENLINALAVDGNKARNLLRAGKELMLEHPFTRESLGNVRKQHASNNPKINYSNGLP